MAWLFERNKEDTDRKRQVLFQEKLNYEFISIPLATAGFQSGIWSNKEINTPDDLRGLKIRLSGIAANVFEKFGTNVQQKNAKINDLPGLLKDGSLDAVEWLSFEDDIEVLELNKVAKFFYYPAWWEPSTSFDLHIKTSSWKKLGEQSPLYQKLLEHVCTELYITSWSHYVMTNCEWLEKKEQWGRRLAVKSFSPEIIQAAREKTDEILLEYSNKNPKFKDIYDEWKETKRKLEKWAEFTKVTLNK